MLPGYLIGLASVLLMVLLLIAPPVQGEAPEAAFLSEMGSAMGTMMADMDHEASGDVDADFVAMMTPHHQGAIDMAIAVLKHGKNENLKRIAQEIIVDQQQEIAAMKLAVGQPLPSSTSARSATPSTASADMKDWSRHCEETIQ